MTYFTKDKPYNTLTEYYKKKYGNKIAKISLNGGFTCPNKDGKKGYGGCIYCSKLGSGDFAGKIEDPLEVQFNSVKEVMNNKWKNTKYIVYFQANSNTYKPVNELKDLFEKAITLDKDIVGIDIATRSDCINEEIASYLGSLNKKIDVTVELGLQSSNEETSKRINQLETNQEFINAVTLLRKENIEIVVHIINGLPGETITDMINTIHFINKLDIQGIKFHSLLVLKDTKLYEEYKEKPFKMLSLEEYVDITVKQITLLKDNIIIHRLSADGKLDDLISPLWTRKKLVVMNEIDKKLRKEKLYQGMNYKNQDND